MGLIVFREFRGAFQCVGQFIQEGDAVRSFVYDADYLSLPEARPISFSLPLRREPYPRNDHHGFFEGMLPEGTTRTKLAHRFHVSPSDYLTLLEHLGIECVGALLFCASGEMEEAFAPSYEALSEKTAEELFCQPDEAAATCMQVSRLSLAGAQSKMGLYRASSENGEGNGELWFFPKGSAPSTHVVKFAADRFSSLPFNELACMRLAEECGLGVAETRLADSFENALVSKRYDRMWAKGDAALVDGLPVPLRLHQEDFCQALGWPSYLKYENSDMICYARVMGNLIQKMSSDVIKDKIQFVRQTLFNYFVGNCDNHLKNHSFLYSPSWTVCRLSPVYDIVCTTILGFDHKMGFEIGEHQVIDEIAEDDWRIFAGDVRVNENTVLELKNEMAETIFEKVPQLEKELPERAVGELMRIFSDMEQRLKR